MECIRFLGIVSTDEINSMTIREYSLRREALRLMKVDESLLMHQSAWLNQRVKAVKRNGDSAYANFSKFFDYEGEINAIEKPSKENDELMKIYENVKKYRERGK